MEKGIYQGFTKPLYNPQQYRRQTDTGCEDARKTMKFANRSPPL